MSVIIDGRNEINVIREILNNESPLHTEELDVQINELVVKQQNKNTSKALFLLELAKNSKEIMNGTNYDKATNNERMFYFLLSVMDQVLVNIGFDESCEKLHDYLKNAKTQDEQKVAIVHPKFAVLLSYNDLYEYYVVFYAMRVTYYKTDGLNIDVHNAVFDKLISECEKTINPPKQKACYIATCVYGSYDCPEVWVLRRYRDNKLAKNCFGRAFIKLYYFISPKIVKLFGNTKWFRKMWRTKLDSMVRKYREEGFEDTPYDDMDW